MKKSSLMKFTGMILLGIGIAGVASATPVPEIDAATGINALALLSGVVLVIRSRKR